MSGPGCPGLSVPLAQVTAVGSAMVGAGGQATATTTAAQTWSGPLGVVAVDPAACMASNRVVQQLY